MSIKEEDMESNGTKREPFIRKDGEEHGSSSEKKNESLWMVYFSTFVAVCGSYEFGCCVS